MQRYIIFSEEELKDMLEGKVVKDIINNITYLSGDTYNQMLEEKEKREVSD